MLILRELQVAEVMMVAVLLQLALERPSLSEPLLVRPSGLAHPRVPGFDSPEGPQLLVPLSLTSVLQVLSSSMRLSA